MPKNFKFYFTQKAGLTEEEYAKLLPSIQLKMVNKGTVLLRDGEVCKDIFFVENGLLRLYSIDEAGKEHILQFASENWFISNRSSVYFNEPSNLFIDAIEDTELVSINKNFMSMAAQMNSSFSLYNERLLHNHILHMQNRINALLGATAEQRYLEFIQLYPDLTLRVNQSMIASYLGITPESLSRVRKALATKNYHPAKE